MLIETIKNLFITILKILKYPAIVVITIFGIIMFIYCSFYLWGKIRLKIKPEHITEHNIPEKKPIIKVIIDGLRTSAYNHLRRDPGEFLDNMCGTILILGDIGQGKTATAVREAINLKKEYPRCKIMSNINITGEDKQLEKWEDVISFENGRKGSVIVIDEVSNLFNSRSFKDFPPEMVGLMTQQRKNAVICFMTAQDLYMCDKVLRTRSKEIWKAHKFFNSIFFISKWRYKWKEDGTEDKKKLKGISMWNLSDEVMNSYDTYKIIEKSKEGFIPKEEQNINRLNMINSNSII